jgi:hypothetical protein
MSPAITTAARIAGYVYKFLVGETLSDTPPLAGTPADV